MCKRARIFPQKIYKYLQNFVQFRASKKAPPFERDSFTRALREAIRHSRKQLELRTKNFFMFIAVMVPTLELLAALAAAEWAV